MPTSPTIYNVNRKRFTTKNSRADTGSQYALDSLEGETEGVEPCQQDTYHSIVFQSQCERYEIFVL